MQGLDCEPTWLDFLQTKKPCMDDRNRYRRLNIVLDHAPELDKVDRLEDYRKIADCQMQKEKPLIDTIADQLAASCFFFHYDQNDMHGKEDGTWVCTGT